MSEILAVVAGEQITKADLDVYLQGVPREQQAVPCLKRQI